MECFENVKKNFGFGCMRLPMVDGEVDTAEFSHMVDAFLEAGFNYFDTAHGYVDEKSETAIRECLTSRYPRDRYVLTDKLSGDYFKSEADIRPFFESQLAACGVEYFDFYLMHSQNADLYKKYKACRAYETAFELKAEGKIRHVGISFHDNPAVLEQILDDYPQIEVVQIQFNYADYEDAAVQSRSCYEACVRRGKPVLVMEPVKGGTLVNLPQEARDIFDGLGGGSYASYALRFAAGFDGIRVVLSGMSNMAQMEDNLSTMTDCKPLDAREMAAIEKVRGVFRSMGLIPCTACRYCVAGCPRHILIPELFGAINAKTAYNDWNSDWYYTAHTQNNGKASDCIQCGQCEKACPQHLKIRELLKSVAKEFERGVE